MKARPRLEPPTSPPATASELRRRIDTVRRFNRFYTQKIGVLQEGLLRTSLSLAEARVMYELAQRGKSTASELGRDLGLDEGYLSRILRGFEKRGLIGRKPAAEDGRRQILALKEPGMTLFAALDTASRDEIGALLERLPEEEQRRLVRMMESIERLLGGGAAAAASYVLRPHQPGDMGWVIHRHGVLYNQEYGWDEQFEALVAEIAARFLRRFDAKRERCWIAERDGENVGCVFLVKRSEKVAQLRLLLVEPRARGLGIGKRLVGECTRFARRAGYRKIALWTNSVLESARRLYLAEGYTLAKEERHHSFGHDLVGQHWELAL